MSNQNQTQRITEAGFSSAEKKIKDKSISKTDRHQLRMLYQTTSKLAKKVAKYFSRPQRVRDITYGKKLINAYDKSYEELRFKAN